MGRASAGLGGSGVAAAQVGEGQGAKVHVRTVENLLDRVGLGTPRAVVIDSPYVLGASHLVRLLTDEARQRGLDLVRGAATQVDGAAPFSTLMSTLLPWVDRVPEVFYACGDRDLGLGAMVPLMRTVRESVKGPTMVLLDEAQWVDQMTALAFRILIPGLNDLPILWVLVRRVDDRDTPVQQALDALIASGTAERVTVLQKNGATPDDLGRQYLGAELDEDLTALVRATGRCPSLTQRILDGLATARAVVIDDRSRAHLGPDAPEVVLTAIGPHLANLRELPRHVLRIASVIDAPCPAAELAALVEVEPGSVAFVTATQQLVEIGLLVESGHELAFGHPLLRDACYQEISVPLRSLLHGAVALRMRGSGRAVAAMTRHLLLSNDPSALESAIDVICRSGDAETVGTPQAVLELAEHVLGVVDVTHARWPALVAGAMDWAIRAGQIEKAIVLGEDALSHPLESVERAGVLRRLVEASKHAGANEDAVRYARIGLEECQEEGEEADLLAGLANALIPLGKLAESDEAAQQALALTQTTGNDAAAVFALCARSVTARARGDLATALEHAEQAVNMAGSDVVRARQPDLWLARALAALDRLGEAERVLKRGIRRSKASDALWALPMWRFHLADVHYQCGNIVDAEVQASAALVVAESSGARQVVAPSLALLAQIAVVKGDENQARRLLDQACEASSRGVSVSPADIDLARAMVEGFERPIEAHRCLQRVRTSEAAIGLLLSRDVSAAVLLVKAALAAKDQNEVRAIEGWVQRLAEAAGPNSSYAGTALFLKGIRSGSPQTVAQAVTILSGAPRRLLLAWALEGLATLDPGGSASVDAAHVRRNLGLPPLDKCPGGATSENGQWSGLTPAEIRVVDLVVSGMTNRQVADELYLSRHTVDSHLRHAFQKLGVTSRVELTRLALVRTAVDQPRDSGVSRD